MKRIFAVLVGLLLLGSVFGIASVTAFSICHCDGTDVIMPNRVSPGQNFIVKQRITCGGNFFTEDLVVAVGEYVTIVEPWPHPEGDYMVFTYKALKSGTIYFCSPGCFTGCTTPSISCFKCEPLTIRNEYPMPQFMKILGIGQKD